MLALAGLHLLGEALTAPLVLGGTVYAAARVRGEPVDFSALWSQVHKWGRVLPLVAANWAGLLPSMFTPEAQGLADIFPPALLVGTALSSVLYFAFIELAINDDITGWGALRLSLSLIRHRVIAVLFVVMLIIIALALSIMLCFLPALFVIPFTTLVWVAMYLAMRGDGRDQAGNTASVLATDK